MAMMIPHKTGMRKGDIIWKHQKSNANSKIILMAISIACWERLLFSFISAYLIEAK
jgi:hypothetical protein